MGVFRFAASTLMALAALTPMAWGQPSCSTGLCLQQVSCPNNGTTSISGVVYAPNGVDPLPNVTVYIPNDTVAAFTPGVSCPVVGAAPSGSPVVGATTAVDGSFTLTNVPVGTNIPLVAVTGRWRRQVVVPSTTACTNTAFSTRMPQTQAEGDIPKIAVATGSADAVECVLLKVGVAPSEFTDASGTGRVNIFGGGGAQGSGVTLDAGTTTQASLMTNATQLSNYDVLMLPCEGSNYTKSSTELANLISFANAGGRVYASHFSYSWMYENPPFNAVANWIGNSTTLADGTATVNTSFTGGQTLSQWLQLVGASTTPGQIAISQVKHDFNGVNAPTVDWLDLNGSGNPVMQFVFDTPYAQAQNQCGKVLYNEYHVETPVTTGNGGGGSLNGSGTFPNECNTTAAMTPQEKLLEYSLFELTSEGGQPSLAPVSANFGSVAYGFTSPAQTFTWTNNSAFPAGVTSVTATGDFAAVNGCATVASGASCTIAVTFTPTALGSRTGTLTVVSSGNTLTATLTGTGTPGYTLSGTSLTWGNLDIGATASQTLTLTNISSGALPVPPFVTSGPFGLSVAACGSSLAAGATCAVQVTFAPVTTGALTGALAVNSGSLLYSGLGATLAGNGVDFGLTINPTSGTVVSGDGTTTNATLTPIAGFSAPVTLSCVVASSAAATSCVMSSATTTLTAQTTSTVTFNTTSQYTVVGYGGLGVGWGWIAGVGSGVLLLMARRRSVAVRVVMVLVVGAACAVGLSGCSGKLPDKNAVYTGPGTYAITVSATDGFLVRTGVFTLTVK